MLSEKVVSVDKNVVTTSSVEETANYKYMVYDRDTIFSTLVTNTLKSLGIESLRTSFRSPWQNGIAERWIGSA